MPLPVRAEERKLNPEIERLLYQVDVVVQEAEGLVDKIDVGQFNWSPGKGRWSIAENLDHLNVTNGLMMAAFSAAVTKARGEGRLGVGPFTYGFLSRWFYRNIQPPVRGRFSAPKKFQPRLTGGVGVEPGVVMEEFRASHERLKQLLVSADGVDLAAVKVESPAMSLFKYELGMGFWILCGHDRRHLWHARNVRNHAQFPK
ncbi:MAG: DinB family protein [Bryobacterales bacterium]|nr:DinB family protein [Bryobacterales bacterium]